MPIKLIFKYEIQPIRIYELAMISRNFFYILEDQRVHINISKTTY